MDVLRDNVNRATGLVKIPITKKIHPGDIIHLTNVEEASITPDVKDAMLVGQQGGYGDAVFDAQNAENAFDPPRMPTVRFGAHDYGIVRIGNLWWTAQNLYEPTPNFGNTADTTSCWACHLEGSTIVWNTSNRNNAGMVYDSVVLNSTWMNDDILHDGWRVPTDADVLALMAVCGIPEGSAYSYNNDKIHLLMDEQYGQGYGVLGFHGIESGVIPRDHSTPTYNWTPTLSGFNTIESVSDSYNHLLQIQDAPRGVGMRLFPMMSKAFRTAIRLCHDV